MAEHVRIIAWLQIVMGVLSGLVGLCVMLFFGGLAGLVGMDADPDARVAVPILGGIGGLIFIFAMLLALPGIIAGAGLLRFAPWARILTIVLSALHLLNIPFGTALGIYAIWALTKPETAALFERRGYPPATY